MTHPLSEENRALIERLLGEMTLGEKIGQMTQAEKNSVRRGDVARLGLGSVLSGGGGSPKPNTPEAWREMVTGFIRESLASPVGIPLLYGVDAVHGHNNVVGATIFPHNIGLGATRDPDLVRRIGRATALEVAATNVRWDFAPAVSLPQDLRWGRTYEGYSQDPALVSDLAVAYIEGLRGEGWDSPTSVLPSVKHYVADGATAFGTSTRVNRLGVTLDHTLALARTGEGMRSLLNQGAWQIDQGDSPIDEATLRSVHLPPYRAAIEAGVLNVMASYSSWQGLKMHAHRSLLTDVLKGELGFQGFVVSDWEAIDQLHPGDYASCVADAVNAGVDMVMVPFDYERFIHTLRAEVEAGRVSGARIDDAVRRILTAKVALGLFERPSTDEALLSLVGCPEHRAVAREAVRKSLVLLKNEGNVLPLSPDLPALLVAGEAADDLGAQCGGWTITWMGGHGPTTPGTTILEGLRRQFGHPARVHYVPNGETSSRYPVGLAVLAEEPYAEGMGDRRELRLSPKHLALLARVRQQCDRLVVVLLSGRPLVITEQVPDWDAFVAAWLPGTEGDGVAEVLCGAAPFTGRLGFDWPLSQADVARTATSQNLWKIGAGLTPVSGEIPPLSPTP
ncbi:glycoside hydrolase family 3 protein [Deinococcus apachensis]|uniref:glycoside hydrolase family 3 protein n=1 Tax=Deinococcus apachensis TaxID=309886 RepID=UPI000376333C|nr:glycoside hydrolase family 3 protein [Deinococcus apachensis]